MKNLINELEKDVKIIIKNKEYIVKTKTWYSIEEDENASYIKCELSANKVLVIIPDDELMYIGKVIENLNFERITEEQLKYNNKIFNKTGDGHQIIKNIEFGDQEEVEGKCVFEDFESDNNIISLGILTDKENKKADVLADIIEIGDIKIE